MENKYLQIIDKFKDLKVLVIGEAMLDTYIKGHAIRLSREAPVPIVDTKTIEKVGGGGANTALNVKSLGAKTFFLSVVGSDEEGIILLKILKEKGIENHVIIDQKRKTLSKNRVIADSQILLRYDTGTIDQIDNDIEEKLIERLIDLFPQMDAVIVSDYGYGIFTEKIIKTIEELQPTMPRILSIDSKDLSKFRHTYATIAKPNYEETTKLLKIDSLKEHRTNQILKMESELLELIGSTIVAVTLDTEGSIVFKHGEAPILKHVKPQKNSNTTGAGDTYISAFTLSIAAQAKTKFAAEIASASTEVIVKKEGTTSCSALELSNYFSNNTNNNFSKKQIDIIKIEKLLRDYKRLGKRIVFTNGCFDILHRGHITYLQQAKSLGQILIVGINSDKSVKRLKGKERPINKLEDRIEVLSAISSIDYIIPFEEDTPINLIKIVKPNIFVKGGDYTIKDLPEAKTVKELGGEVKILPFIVNRSTTEIIKKIRQKEVQVKSGLRSLSQTT